MKGTRVTVSRLRDLHRPALELNRLAGDALAGLFPGSWHSRSRGRGVEFDEVRPYQWGDDYRSLDWKVTARTGNLHTKLFHEERERTLWLVLDAGPAMQFGTCNCFKWVRAAEVAALLAWLAHDGGDRIGAIVHGDGRRCRILPAGGGQPALGRLFHLLAASGRAWKDPASTLADALGHLRHLAHPGSRVLLLGDFSGFDDEARRRLASLRPRGSLAAIRIEDPLERELPEPGRYPFTDARGRCRGVLDTGSPALRKAWRERGEARLEQLVAQLRQLDVRPLRMATDDPLVQALDRQLRGGGR